MRRRGLEGWQRPGGFFTELFFGHFGVGVLFSGERMVKSKCSNEFVYLAG